MSVFSCTFSQRYSLSIRPHSRIRLALVAGVEPQGGCHQYMAGCVIGWWCWHLGGFTLTTDAHPVCQLSLYFTDLLIQNLYLYWLRHYINGFMPRCYHSTTGYMPLGPTTCRIWNSKNDGRWNQGEVVGRDTIIIPRAVPSPSPIFSLSECARGWKLKVDISGLMLYLTCRTRH